MNIVEIGSLVFFVSPRVANEIEKYPECNYRTKPPVNHFKILFDGKYHIIDNKIANEICISDRLHFSLEFIFELYKNEIAEPDDTDPEKYFWIKLPFRVCPPFYNRPKIESETETKINSETENDPENS